MHFLIKALLPLQILGFVKWNSAMWDLEQNWPIFKAEIFSGDKLRSFFGQEWMSLIPIIVLKESESFYLHLM